MLNWTVWNKTDYLHKMDLVLNNLQRLICHKTQPTNQLHKQKSRYYAPFLLFVYGNCVEAVTSL